LALRRHEARQLEQKLAVGARYQDSGLVFTWLGRVTDPSAAVLAVVRADTVARLILGGGVPQRRPWTSR
jgi:hypothetical protein